MKQGRGAVYYFTFGIAAKLKTRLKTKIMKHRLSSLRSRLMLLVWAIILVLLVLETVTVLIWYGSRYRQEVKNNLDVAQVIGLAFEGFVRNVSLQQYAIGVACQTFMPNSQDDIQKFLSQVSESFYAVNSFSIVDSGGMVIASSRPQSVGLNVSDRNYFVRLKEGDSTVVSDYLYSKLGDVAGFIIGRGFLKSSGEFDFAVLGTVRADKLGEITFRLNREDGEFYTLFDRQGTLVFTNQSFDTMAVIDRSWKSKDPLLRKALQGDDAVGFFSAPVGKYRNRIGARVPIRGIGWVAGAAISRRAFFLPIILSFGISLLVLILVAGVTLFFAKRTVGIISNSLSAVQLHVARVAQGEFAAIRAESGFSEFDALISDANSMAQKLKNREEALRSSEERFRGAIEGLFDAFVIMSPIRDDAGTLVDYRFEYANRVALELAELNRDEFVGRKASEIFPIETQQSVLPIYDQVLRTGHPAAIDAYPVKAPLGAYQRGLFIDIRASNLNGNLSLAWRDVTERVNFENAIIQSEANFRTMADNISQFAWVTNDKGAVVWYNKRWYDYTGTNPEEMVGWGWQKVLHPDHVERVVESISRSMEKGLFWEDTYPIRGKNGSYRWFLSRAVPIKDNEGKVVRWFGTNTDITKQKETEEKLRKTEERFRQLSNSMPQLVWTAKPDGTVDYYNEKYRDFGGISPGPDGIWHWGPVVYEEDLQPTIDAWNHSVKTGEIYQIEHRIIHADGTIHWYLSRGVPVRDESGNIIKWYGTATNIDISKQAQLALGESENRLKALNQNLEDKVIKRTEQVRDLSKALTIAEQRERRRFSYILHDNLQQLLLGARILFNQHIREHVSLDQTELIDDVKEGLAILDKALKTSRSLSIELNPPVLRTQGLDAALRWLSNHMQKSYGLKIYLRMMGAIDDVKDETQLMLTQMVRELLNNIVQHSGVLSALVDAVCENGFLKIVVRDEGRGFNPEDVFKRNVDETRLGLISIRERLKLFGGDLIVDSAPGSGTRSEIVLPVEKC